MADQGGHWYRRETGEPCHEIVGANGVVRTPTMRDAKRGLKGKLAPFEIVPSVTGIIGAFGVALPVANWMARTALECAASEEPYDPLGESTDDYVRRISAAADKKKAKAPALGTEVHDVIEAYLLGNERDALIQAETIAAPALKWIDANVVKVLGVEQTFATPVYGGTLDLYAELTNSRVGIVDFKTQGTKEQYGHRTRAYDEWGEQLIAYGEGHGKPFNVLCNVVMSTTQPGEWGEHTWTDIPRLRRQWHCKLRYYQLKNNWWPLGRRAA